MMQLEFPLLQTSPGSFPGSLPLDHAARSRHGMWTPNRTHAVPAPSGRSADVALMDWDLMLDAVRARLTDLVTYRPKAYGESGLRGPGELRATVLDCVAALDQLHQTLAQAMQHNEHLQTQLADLKLALSQARTQLAGTQAGEVRAHHLALHDSLTALPNRRFFEQQLEHALSESESPPQDLAPASLAVLYLDLDNFKPVNDQYGHATGDELLRIISSRLSHAVRSEDMASRLGGDEFACLRRGPVDREQLGQLAHKLLDAVAAPLQVGALKISVEASIGIALYPADGSDSAALLKAADQAMYRAKRERSGFAFSAVASLA